MKKGNKILALTLSAALAAGCLAGCGSKGGSDSKSGSFDTSQEISVVSREEGSGTRGAFVELTGVEEKDADGNKVDKTTTSAITANSTEVVLTTVAGDDYSIGYISLGALNDTVKAVKIGGVEATADNINNGTYTLSRPFNIVTKGQVSDVAQDFINYIMSEDGQKIVSSNGYIEIANSGAFKSSGATGKIVIAGSSSVTPVMEKLTEAYKAVNSGADIELQESDSTTGITAAADGTCDIGMASRELKDSETGEGLTATVIAMDGIAVIVNKNNPATDLTTDQVKSIFTGEAATWAFVSIAAVLLICVFLFASGIPAMKEIGLTDFLFGKVWRPTNDYFGILPFILGSIYVTAGAIVIGVPIGLLTAIFLSKFCPPKAYKVIKPFINLMAGIPSVVYGFFGMCVLVPAVRQIFGVNGNTMLTASVLLGIMILPTIISVSETSISAVPDKYYQGALALGATHERSVFLTVVPAARSGIMAAIILGVGRAIGETMAVIMVAGNQVHMPKGLMKGVRTMTANIVMEMGYAQDLHREALIATGVVLFVFILIINLLFSILKRKTVN